MFMPTVYISDEANSVLENVRLFVSQNKGIAFNQSQAIMYLNKAWEDAAIEPEIYYTDVDNPSESAIFYKPFGAVVLSKEDYMKPKLIKAGPVYQCQPD